MTTENDLQVAALERAVGVSRPPIVASVAVKPSRPTYDEATDGNRFAWILRAAAAVRIQERAANENARIQLAIARRSAMPVIVDRADAK
jgi:hypothetical protein